MRWPKAVRPLTDGTVMRRCPRAIPCAWMRSVARTEFCAKTGPTLLGVALQLLDWEVCAKRTIVLR